MAKKKILKQGNETVYPITNESCVLDNNGTSLKAKIGDLSELITDNKTNLVSAINDIVALNGNVKQQVIEALIENGVECSINDSWSTIVNKINEGAGGGLDIISATELPVSVKDKQLVVVTDTPMTEAVFHNLQPTIGSGIQEGGVWINTTNNNNVFEYIVSDSPKFSFYILDCYQVISGSYVKKQIYCGVNGTWQHVNPNLYFIQEFINDNPLTEVDGSFRNTYNAGTGCQRLHYNTNGGNHSAGGTHKTVKTFNTTGFSKVGIRFSATHTSTLILRFYDVTTKSQIGYARGSSSTTIKTLELDIANINDLCYIHVDIDSDNNVSGNYIVDIYDLYLTN